MSPGGVWDKMPFSESYLILSIGPQSTEYVHEESVISCGFRYQNKQLLFPKTLEAHWVQLDKF